MLRRLIFIYQCLSMATASAVTAPLPAPIEQFLRAKNRGDLIERWNQVQFVSPERFSWIFLYARQPEFLAAGYFGITFRADDSLFKFSHAIFSSLGMAELNPARTTIPQGPDLPRMRGLVWSWLKQNDVIQELQVYEQHKGVLLGGASVLDELYGELIAAALNPSRKVILADFVSTDGLALVRPFLPGIPFQKVLESERQQTELHKAYDMPALWRQLVSWQRGEEAMLFETGVTVDGLTPGNFLVQGQGAAAKLVHFDTGLVQPSSDVRDLYRSWGVILPRPLLSGVITPATEWPAFPNHILYSKVWDLSLTQAQSYARAWTGAKNERDLLRWISQIPVLPIGVAPGLVDASVIQECARLLHVAP